VTPAKKAESKNTTTTSSLTTEDSTVDDITNNFAQIAFTSTGLVSPLLQRSGFGSPLLPKNMFSPSQPQPASAETNLKVLKTVELLEALQIDGSFEYPNIQIFNFDNAEKNDGFKISLVPLVTHKGFDRKAFHIRRVVSGPQVDDWKATIPHDRFPALAERCVLIRGPSQDFWHQSPDRYHSDKENIDCDQTKKIHQMLQQAIQQDDKRKYMWWLLVFPKGVHLENHVFSDDATIVKKHLNDLYATIRDDGDKIDLCGMDIYWKIAIKGGELVGAEATEKPKKKLFKKKHNNMYD